MLTAVISFCSNDWRFLKHCIEGVKPFSSHILITVCDHFFDGSEENFSLLEEAFRQFPECTFIEFQYDASQTYRAFSPIYPDHPDWRHEWHNTGRWLGAHFAETEYVFFLDCDEIIDRLRFSSWLEQTDLSVASAWRFSGYWHFREAYNRATTYDDVSLLVNSKSLDANMLWDVDERLGLAHKMSGEKKFGVKGLDNLPLIHHFSGVRPKEEMRKKLITWGHHWERSWEALLEEEYSRPFNGTDFLRHYTYVSSNVFFDPLIEQIPTPPSITKEEHLIHLTQFPNVILATRKDMQQKEIYDWCRH